MIMKLMTDTERYRWLFRSCPAYLASINVEGRYVDLSDAFLDRLGFQREDLVGRHPQDHMTPESACRFTEEYLPRFLRTGQFTDVPMDRIAKNGEVIEFVVNAIAERDQAGNVVRSIAVFTERLAHARVEHRYQQLYRQTPAMLHTTGLDGRVEAVSDYWLAKLGYRREEVIGAPVIDFLTDASRQRAAECMPQAFETGALHGERLDFATRHGDVIEGLVSAVAERGSRGEVLRMLVVIHDVTERNRAEAEKFRAYDEIARLNEELTRERDYLREEVKTALNFGQIVGGSKAIERVLEQVELVAPTDANVVILGESGTGKELIASAIHERSTRREAAMIRVNCGAIPDDLFESEFFGHVKGAFTGAVKDRLGRFELADKGTIFLDEVGEIPLGLQGKLLRVLQEGTFERVGEERTRKADVRLVAATNRDLASEVRAGCFREDLYFRLNVIPIEVPPLRERVDDIAQLTVHFARLACEKLGRPCPKLTRENIVQLQSYHWPGNIRELQNIIERAVILSRNGRLDFDLPPRDPPTGWESANAAVRPCAPASQSPEAVRRKRDREDIIAALRKANGKVFGSGGAGEILGVKPTTLASRIKALGIEKPLLR